MDNECKFVLMNSCKDSDYIYSRMSRLCLCNAVSPKCGFCTQSILINRPLLPSVPPHALESVCSSYFAVRTYRVFYQGLHLLSAWIEAVLLGHAWTLFELCTCCPRHGYNTKYASSHNCCVCFPIGRLRVPSTGGRPDVLWVSAVMSVSRRTICAIGN